MNILWYQPDDMDYCKIIEANLSEKFSTVELIFCDSMESLEKELRAHNSMNTVVILQIHDKKSIPYLWDIQELFLNFYTIVLFDDNPALQSSDTWFLEPQFSALFNSLIKKILFGILHHFGKTNLPREMIRPELAI